MRNYRVTAIGTTGVGKTWYMAALYKVLGRGGIGGFQLKTSLKMDSLLARMWEDICDSGLDQESDDKREVLRGNKDSFPLDFELWYRDQFIMKLLYLDYRGGAIDDASEAEDVSEVMKYLVDSDGLMVLADSSFIDGTHPDIAERANKIPRMRALLDQFFKLHPSRNLSLAFVITKSDLISRNGLDEFVELARTHFGPVVSLLREKGLPGRLFPVSVVGPEYATVKFSRSKGTKILEPRIERNIQDGNGKEIYPRPEGVELPLLFCIRSCLENELEQREQAIARYKSNNIDIKRSKDDARKAISKAKKDRDKAARKSSMTSNWWLKMNGKESYDAEAARHYHTEEVLANKLKSLQQKENKNSHEIGREAEETAFLHEVIQHLTARLVDAGWEI